MLLNKKGGGVKEGGALLKKEKIVSVEKKTFNDKLNVKKLPQGREILLQLNFN